MRSNNKYSRTAAGVALLRTLEQIHPASGRILNDPYAAAFLRDPCLKAIAAVMVPLPCDSSLHRFLVAWSAGDAHPSRQVRG